MQKLIQITGTAILLLSMAACSNETDAPESSEVSETRMDDVDVIDGTISDDMVDVDTQASEDAVGASEETEETSNTEDASEADSE